MKPIWFSAMLAAWVCFSNTEVCGASSNTKLQPQRVRDYTRLMKILKQHKPRHYTQFRTGPAVATDLANSWMGLPSTASSESASYSRTITQSAGVDEGDIVKNDEGWIYQINDNRVLIVSASPLSPSAQISFTDGNFYAQELYLNGSTLAVIGTSFQNPLPMAYMSRLMSPLFSTSTVQVKIYDVSDPLNPRETREVEVEGDYVATRMIGSVLYLVTREYPECYGLAFKTAATLRLATPAVRDSKVSKKFRNISPMNCFYFPGFDDPDYLVVTSVDTSGTRSSVRASALLGAGECVYASMDNLYVSASRYLDAWVFAETGVSIGTVTSFPTMPATGGALVSSTVPAIQEQTDLYKFALNSGQPSFSGSGTVPGTVLNSYSMDEYEGYLRVATTTHGAWFAGSANQNGVYVLDPALQTAGSVEGIAPGEQIYAARFLGSRLFLVTYRQVDPLFAIDLSTPSNPQVVGQLEMPGYSSFLAPLDENHLIGIGKDVSQVAVQDDPSMAPVWRVQSGGVKLALFDVSDMTQPKLVDSVVIGSAGSDSPAIYDPHALLLDPAMGLLALPVSVTGDTSTPEATPDCWWLPTFQGAYVYSVSSEGFTLRGTVTHRVDGQDWWDQWQSNINRLLYIGSNLYSLSDFEVKANDLQTLEETDSTLLPQVTYSGGEIGGGVITGIGSGTVSGGVVTSTGAMGH